MKIELKIKTTISVAQEKKLYRLAEGNGWNGLIVFSKTYAKILRKQSNVLLVERDRAPQALHKYGLIWIFLLNLFAAIKELFASKRMDKQNKSEQDDNAQIKKEERKVIYKLICSPQPDKRRYRATKTRNLTFIELFNSSVTLLDINTRDNSINIESFLLGMSNPNPNQIKPRVIQDFIFGRLCKQLESAGSPEEIDSILNKRHVPDHKYKVMVLIREIAKLKLRAIKKKNLYFSTEVYDANINKSTSCQEITQILQDAQKTSIMKIQPNSNSALTDAYLPNFGKIKAPSIMDIDELEEFRPLIKSTEELSTNSNSRESNEEIKFNNNHPDDNISIYSFGANKQYGIS